MSLVSKDATSVGSLCERANSHGTSDFAGDTDLQAPFRNVLVKFNGKFRGLSFRDFENKDPSWFSLLRKLRPPTKLIRKVYMKSNYDCSKTIIRKTTKNYHLWPVKTHDVTKIQTTILSSLLRFYFHGVLEQLKTNFQTNFRFKRVVGFVIEYA